MQAYTPRGRTTRDVPPPARRTSEAPAEPARATLRVVDGGKPAAVPGPRQKDARRPARARRRRRGPRRRPPPARPRPRPRRGAHRRARKPRKAPTLADPRRRLRLGAFLALALFGVIGIRLVSMQVVETPAYADAGLDDRLRTVTLFAPRGAIFDRSGAALAHSVEARYVYADPELVTDAPKAAAALSPLLGIAASELQKRMAKRMLPGGGPSNFEWLARGVPIATADRVEALNLPGIGVKRDERREVPGADLAANMHRVHRPGHDRIGGPGGQATTSCCAA